MIRGLNAHSLPKHHFYSPAPKRFPEDIQCIIKSKDPDHGSLYISNIEAAQNSYTLKKYNIKAVMTCAKGYQLKHQKHTVNNYLYIPAVDHESYDLSVHFEEAVDFIVKNLKKANVLVHCIAGVSRSVSMVIAYFIKQHQMDFEQAYSRVKSQRHIINPNSGFVSQLKQYQKEIQNLYRINPRQSQSNAKIMAQSYLSYKDDRHRAVTPEPSSRKGTRFNGQTTKYQQKYLQTNNYLRYDTTPQPKPVSSKQLLSKSMMRPNTRQYEQSYLEKFSPLQGSRPINRQNYGSNYNYFQSLNTELQEKIQNIRKKYDEQRQQLQQRYNMHRKVSQYSGKNSKYQTYNQQTYPSQENQNYKFKTEFNDPYSRMKTYAEPKNHNFSIDQLFPKRFFHQQIRGINKKDKEPNLYTNPIAARETLENSRYRDNDALRYKKYEVPRGYQMYNTLGNTFKGGLYH